MKKHLRPNEKQSVVMKHGVRVKFIPLAAVGGVAYNFHIKVIITDSAGRIRVKESTPPNKRYPAKGSKKEPSVWDVIDTIYDYYYDQIIKNQASKPKELNNDEETTPQIASSEVLG